MCESCRRRPATIQYAEVVDGEMTTFNLCEECARERGVAMSFAPFAGPLVSILMGLLEEAGERGEAEERGPVCPGCGLSYREFRTNGRLGCAECYEAFADELRPVIRRIHGSTRHSGGVPESLAEGADSQGRMRRLRGELEAAVRSEEYERAAELRDEIRDLERGLAADGGTDVDV